MSHSTIDKLRKMLRILEHQQHYRENYMAVGNAMSFRDHPYLYQNSDGTISVEYPCPKSWRENVAGVTTPLCINLEDPSEHGDHQIGTITHGWSDERDGPDDVLDYDRDALRTLLENSGATGSEVYRRLVVGLEPDVSTEYYCRHEVRNGRKWQVGFQPIRTCIVDRGNCPSGVCDFTPVEDPGHGDDDRDGFAA